MAQKEKKYLLVWAESEEAVGSFSSDSFDKIEERVTRILLEDFDLEPSDIDAEYESLFKVFDLDTREEVPFSLELKVVMSPVNQVRLNR